MIFSGKMQLKNKLESHTWKQLFDTSVLKPRQVCAWKHQVMFVDHDDSLWAMGAGLFESEDPGWLRRIESPPECRDF